MDSVKADMKVNVFGNSTIKKLYNGWFTNKENINKILTTVNQLEFKKKKLGILEIGAGKGIVGEAFRKKLKQKGHFVNLVISDLNKELIKKSKIKAKKVVFDNKKIPYNDNTFDLVIARSVLQYEKNKRDMLKAINEVRRILKKEGYFVIIHPTFKTKKIAKTVQKINLIVKKRLTLQTLKEFNSLLKSFKNVKTLKIDLPPMVQSSEDFFIRYDLFKKQKEIMEKINKIKKIGNIKNTKQLYISKTEFKYDVFYKVFICKK